MVILANSSDQNAFRHVRRSCQIEYNRQDLVLLELKKQWEVLLFSFLRAPAFL